MLSDFQFELPQSLLAQRPAIDRDESRLMVLNRENESIEHHTFKEVINFVSLWYLEFLKNEKTDNMTKKQILNYISLLEKRF